MGTCISAFPPSIVEIREESISWSCHVLIVMRMLKAIKIINHNDDGDWCWFWWESITWERVEAASGRIKRTTLNWKHIVTVFKKTRGFTSFERLGWICSPAPHCQGREFPSHMLAPCFFVRDLRSNFVLSKQCSSQFNLHRKHKQHRQSNILSITCNVMTGSISTTDRPVLPSRCFNGSTTEISPLSSSIVNLFS